MFYSEGGVEEEIAEEPVKPNREKTRMLLGTLKKEATRVGRGSLLLKRMKANDNPNESADPALLKKWYKLNRNQKPPVYQLCRVT